MDILYYLNSFPKLSESFILNEVYELERRGHDVAVFALNNPGEEIEHEEYGELDVTVEYARSPGYGDLFDLFSPAVLNRSVLKHALFRGHLKEHAEALHRARQCIEFVAQQQLDIDIVHTHFAQIPTFPARYVSSYFDVPFTVTTHAADLYHDPNQHQLSHMLGTADRVVTISEYNREYIQDEITDSTPVDIVHAGIRPEKFDSASASSDRRILSVSRFVEKKGLRYAIDAVSELVTRYPDVEYRLVGSGALGDELREQIDAHGLHDTVELLGNVTDEELIAEFDAASCFLLPCVVAESGDRDGIPVALMESMAMETPPVSTSVSGIPELIDDHQNGLLVPPEDPDELADAIELLLDDPQLQARFGEAGRKKVTEEFDVRTEAAKLEAVFEKTIANNRPRQS